MLSYWRSSNPIISLWCIHILHFVLQNLSDTWFKADVSGTKRNALRLRHSEELWVERPYPDSRSMGPQGASAN